MLGDRFRNSSDLAAPSDFSPPAADAHKIVVVPVPNRYPPQKLLIEYANTDCQPRPDAATLQAIAKTGSANGKLDKAAKDRYDKKHSKDTASFVERDATVITYHEADRGAEFSAAAEEKTFCKKMVILAIRKAPQ